MQIFQSESILRLGIKYSLSGRNKVATASQSTYYIPVSYVLFDDMCMVSKFSYVAILQLL